MQRHLPFTVLTLVLTLALTLALTLFAGLQYQKNEALELQLQSLQQKLDTSASSAAAVLATEPDADIALDEAIAGRNDSGRHAQDIEQRLVALERQFTANRQEARQQSVAADQARDLAQTVIDGGFLDEASWQPVAAQVEAMSAAENKAFWEKTFAAIESGQLAVADTE